MGLVYRLAILLVAFTVQAGGNTGTGRNIESPGPAPAGQDERTVKHEEPDHAVDPATLTPYRVEYTARYNGLPITLARTFSPHDGGYRIATEASNFLGSITEEETFAAPAAGNLDPIRYRYRRSIFGNKRREETVFDHRNRRITNTYKKETVDLPYAGNVLGPLSYQIQMQLDLLAGTREFSYPVVTRGRIKDYLYRITREETIDTPLGKIDTLVLERVRDDDERETYLWLAEKFQYLPVKLLQREDGESYEMLIQSYTLLENE